MDKAQMLGRYAAGWRASENGSPTALERADARGAHDLWYRGYFDHACERPRGFAIFALLTGARFMHEADDQMDETGNLFIQTAPVWDGSAWHAIRLTEDVEAGRNMWRLDAMWVVDNELTPSIYSPWKVVVGGGESPAPFDVAMRKGTGRYNNLVAQAARR